MTYDGDITGDHVWSISGSKDGDAVTTFTGTVSIKGHDGNYADLSGINFEGKVESDWMRIVWYLPIATSRVDTVVAGNGMG